ncbi:phage portal protein [Clostridium perfringens]|uniref:phage portal protein n=1 Tax=Clostridium perfringens TaxID=1502 RepID=UPI001CAF1A1C|nr:phage portal protein [Clostridium perfringens]MDK0718754.1 phage portal protein [Clostridium perfringens]MDU1597811.1 phage portal protein [Clostridium perfringens]UBK61538.1 phage portal protein [Clostridium perfringens]STB61766.1 Phage portal protein, SPP1 Gp6-like [Clostridium perfringens]HBI7027401.1 phage portal protein [Clostridium perfringens]
MELKKLGDLISKDRVSSIKAKAKEGIAYYKGQHEILNYRLFYYDSNGMLKEDKYRSNIQIPHQFHTELVDQKVQYLLSNPIEVITEDQALQDYLKEYINEDFQEVLQNAIEGASNKGLEYIYAYVDSSNKISFQVADSLNVIPVYDELNNYSLKCIVRYYDTKIQDNDKQVTITKAEVWTDKDVTYYVKDGDSKDFKLDDSIKPNPRPHIVLEDEKAFYNGGSLGYIPFFKLQNNKYEKTDLEPIKALIDDYDLMACSLSNNLQDFQEAIYVVRGYPGDNLDELTTNLKTKKTIGVDETGGLDVKTIDIPHEARKVKLDLDKESIYKFGMGFDSSQIGDGNITNVVIKSRYALLDLKCNKAEIRLRKLIRQLLKVIVEDINKRFNKAYNFMDIDINIVRETMVNENDIANNEKLEAEKQGQLIDNILVAATRLDDDTVLKCLCNILELDYEEVKEKLEKQEIKNVDFNSLSEQMLNDPKGVNNE